LNGNASAERDGEGIDIGASAFNLLPRPRLVNPGSLFCLISKNVVGALRYIPKAEAAFFVGCVLAIKARFACDWRLPTAIPGKDPRQYAQSM